MLLEQEPVLPELVPQEQARQQLGLERARVLLLENGLGLACRHLPRCC